MTVKARRVPFGSKHWECRYDKVYSSGYYGSSQCGNRAKYDPDVDGNPTKCGIHCEAALAKRKAKSDAKYAAYMDKKERERHHRGLTAEAVQIVRQIAEGHNDPRALAIDWVSRKEPTNDYL